MQTPTGRRYWDEQVETLDRERLRELQSERIAAQVARCAAASSLYRRKLDEAGAEPGEIDSPERLAELPVVTKQELRDDQVAHPPFGSIAVAPRETWRELHPSTGTTGSPVNTIWSAADVNTIADFSARTMWQAGVRPGDVVQNGFAYGLWVAGISTHYAAGRVGCLVIPTGASVSSEKQIEFLTRAGSTVLISTPSYALHIAEALRERGIGPDEIPLRMGIFGGEPGAENEATRHKIEQGLGISAYDYYGLAEIGPTFASECEAKAGIHFAEDHVLVECVDPETLRPVADGELGVLVFTHLTREASPMLRYWSNDYARLTHERCVCGRTHARAVGGILGRHDDLVVFKGAKFYPTQVEKAVRGIGSLSDEFRVEVRYERGGGMVEECIVVVEALGGDEVALREPLRAALRAELGVTPEVRFVPYGTIERTTFKAKRIVELDD